MKIQEPEKVYTLEVSDDELRLIRGAIKERIKTICRTGGPSTSFLRQLTKMRIAIDFSLGINEVE